MLLGDVNLPLIASDKFSAQYHNWRKARALWDILDTCGFIDLGFLVPQYTWTNKRENDPLIMERIDGV